MLKIGNSDGKCSSNALKKNPHTRTHRLDLHMHLSYSLWQKVKLGERHDSRERRAFFWLPPSIRKLRYQQQMDGLLEGYSGFNWPCKIRRFVLQSRPDSDIRFNELRSLRSQLLISLHGEIQQNFLLKKTMSLTEHFSCRSESLRMCVQGLFVRFAVLARLGSVTFYMILGGVIAAGLCTHRWGAWPEGRSGKKKRSN